MNRSLTAACAAILLAGTLTACSSTPANNQNLNTDPGMTNSGTSGTPSGTSYVAPRRTQYPNGAEQDRASYNRMTSSRTRSTVQPERRPDSRYTAYSDGYVYPGNDALTPNSGPGLAHDVARSARNMVTGVGDMFRDAGNAVRSVTGGNDTGDAVRSVTGGNDTAARTNANQRMGNNVDNTLLNANAE